MLFRKQFAPGIFNNTHERIRIARRNRRLSCACFHRAPVNSVTKNDWEANAVC